MRDLIIEQNNLGLKGSDWNGYDEVTYNFALWMNRQRFIDRFYVAVFEARRNNLTSYSLFTELFELDQDYKIIWQIDWCEGENDIINIRFYSFMDIMKMALEYEYEYISSHEWFNKKNKKW